MDDGMSCRYHPYRSNQEDLCSLSSREARQIISSSSPLLLPPSSSSSSFSFRSDFRRRRLCRFVRKFGGHCHDHHAAAAARLESPFCLRRRSNRGRFPPRMDWSLFYLSTKSHSSRKIDHGFKEKSTETYKDFSGTAEDDGEDSPNSSHASASASASFLSLNGRYLLDPDPSGAVAEFLRDFLERITGFGDVHFRRVSLTEEGKPKITSTASPP
ncbi:hypothetical protein SDJN02_20475, partial [Cucurbita argyrosperma subsp. argyrosperma]